MALPFADNFNRADGALSGAGKNWTDTSDVGATPRILSNAVTSDSGGGDSAAYVNSESYNANQWAECKITTASDGGPSVRASSSGCYYFTGTSSAAAKCSVWRYKSGGNWVKIGSSFSVVFSSTDVIRLEATGTTTTTLKVYLNGSLQATVTDSSSPLTSGAAGIYVVGSTTVDDFNSDNVSAGTTYTDTGADQSPHRASGVDSRITPRTGSDTSPHRAAGADRKVYKPETGAVSASRQTSGADVRRHIYNEAGAAQVSHQAGGAEVYTPAPQSQTYTDTGAAQSSKQASGLEALVNVTTGQAQAPHMSSGVDALLQPDTGAAQAALSASGAESVTTSDVGASVTPRNALGVDLLTNVTTGAVETPHSASGEDSALHIYADAGAGESSHAAGSTDSTIATDTGASETPHVATGEDVYIQRGAVSETGAAVATAQASGVDAQRHIYAEASETQTPFSAAGLDSTIAIEAGASETPHSATGADAYSHEYIEAGSVETPRATSGADVLAHVTGATATAPCSVSGLDCVINVTTGGATSTRAGSGVDALFGRVVYVDTGAAQSPHAVSGADTHTTQGGGHGDAFPANAEYRGVGWEYELPSRVNDDEEVLLAYALL